MVSVGQYTIHGSYVLDKCWSFCLSFKREKNGNKLQIKTNMASCKARPCYKISKTRKTCWCSIVLVSSSVYTPQNYPLGCNLKPEGSSKLLPITLVSKEKPTHVYHVSLNIWTNHKYLSKKHNIQVKLTSQTHRVPDETFPFPVWWHPWRLDRLTIIRIGLPYEMMGKNAGLIFVDGWWGCFRK